jgi:hypothetical protein
MVCQPDKHAWNMQADILTQLRSMRPVVPPDGPAIYLALIETGEVKIGTAFHVEGRLRDVQRKLGLKTRPVLLGLLPGGRPVESDLHARLAANRSRTSGPLERELYAPTREILALLDEVRGAGFTAEDFAAGSASGVSTSLPFTNGETLRLDMTYLHVIEEGHLSPRYVLTRLCHYCGRVRSCLDFLNGYDVRHIGRAQNAPCMVLQETERCRLCAGSVPFPAEHAFVDGHASLRIGRMTARDGAEILGYDRHFRRWAPLIEFGIRRMAKEIRPGHAGDAFTMRLQPRLRRRARPAWVEPTSGLLAARS